MRLYNLLLSLNNYEQSIVKDIKKKLRFTPLYKHELQVAVNYIRYYSHLQKINKYGDISTWDTSKITNMSYLFHQTDDDDFEQLNIDISNWDTSNVTNMKYMFGTSFFNGDISKWNTSKVKNMEAMFRYSIFNGNISKWDMSNVETMDHMFYGAKFNGDISNWKTSKVQQFDSMFVYSLFTGDISKWDMPPCAINEMFDEEESIRRGIPINN
jgi:surface protein